MEFRLRGRLLGYPGLAADGRRLVLELGGVPVGDLSQLAVWRSGQRLDRLGKADTSRLTSAPSMVGKRRLLEVDPGEPGRWDTRASSYRLADFAVPGFDVPVEMLGHVVAPRGADGPRPLVLLLHGAHATCFDPDTQEVSGGWPCEPDDTAIPSYLGFGYLQRLLASQGYVTVSISANGINGQEFGFTVEDFGMTQRSALVRNHLRTWASWAAGEGRFGERWAGRVDMGRVLLVGHSRGGEGVARAAIDTPASAPWDVAGQVLIAPTAFGLQQAPYVPTVSLLPYCDGDVVWLSGQAYVDLGRDVVHDPALRSAVMVMGANHNFFNTEWTPGLTSTRAGDDAVQLGTCQPGSSERLTSREQRSVGRAYVAGAARLLLRDDRAVLPLYDGSRARVRSTGRAEVLSSALGGRRQMLRPRLDGTAVDSGGEVRLCVGRSVHPDPKLCGGGRSEFQTPHWPSADLSKAAPAATAVELGWTSPGAQGGLELAEPVDISRARSLDSRVIVDPRRGDVRLAVKLVDADGGTAVLRPRGGERLRAFPGQHPLGKLWGQTVRVDLRHVTGVDLTRITRVLLVAHSDKGRVWLLDAAARRLGLSPLPDARVPRVDVHDVSVREGSGGGTGVLKVPVVFDTTLTRSARLSVLTVDLAAEEAQTSRLTVPAGQDAAVVKIPYERDDRDDFDVSEHIVRLFAQRRVMTSDYRATAIVRDDDPTPQGTFASLSSHVVEGQALRWRLELDRPADYSTVVEIDPVPVAQDAVPVKTGDLPRRYLRRVGIDPDAPPVPLAATEVRFVVELAAGTTAGTVRIPTALDKRAEQRESVRLRTLPHPFLNERITLKGTLSDAE